MEINNLEKYYKNIEKPIINDCLNKLNLKNILELSTITDLYLFTKKKKTDWKLKEKRILLKECDIKRKQKIKEFTDNLNELSKYKSKNILSQVKEKSNNIFNDIETLENMIESIEKDYPEIENNFLEKFSN
jgi:gas vesicle protein